MKKITIGLLTLGLLVSGFNLALAHGGSGKSHDDDMDDMMDRRGRMIQAFGFDDEDEEELMIMGTLSAKTDDTLTVALIKPALVDGTASLTVAMDEDTEVIGPGTQNNIANVAVGSSIMVRIEREDGEWVAEKIHLRAKGQVVFGEVTAKTDNSVTLKNNVTGETKTVLINPDTQIKINGEAKTAADIQVGDRGFAKLRLIADQLIAKVIRLFR